MEFSPVQKTQRFRPRLAFGACGVMVICAAAAFFADGHRSAAIIAGQAWLACFLTYGAIKRGKL